MFLPLLPKMLVTFVQANPLSWGPAKPYHWNSLTSLAEVSISVCPVKIIVKAFTNLFKY
jgi:hypothetical protein